MGAIILGFTGLASGMALCLYLELPIPPVFITEMGVLLGGSLGALVGYSCAYEGMRGAWLGLLLGLLMGVVSSGPGAMALVLGVIGAVVGRQAEAPEQQNDWETV